MAALRVWAIESRSCSFSSGVIGWNARARSTFRSMNSSFGMPQLARLTGSERA